MPPLLEVVDDSHPEAGLDWLDEPAGNDHLPDVAPESPADASDIGLASELDLDGGLQLSSPAEPEPAEQLRFDAVEFENDDQDVQDQDTEVEELPLAAPAALGHEAPGDAGAAPLGEGDADLIDFGAEVAKNEPDGVGDRQPPSFTEEVTFNFEDAESQSTLGEEEISFDFAEEPAASESQPEVDELGLPVRAAAADDEPIELDFAAADADPTATLSSSEEPEATGKKKKAARLKKVRKEKAPGEPRKRSLVGTLLTVVLAAVIAIPAALYGAIWISTDYDFIGMRKWLPGAILPAGKPARALAVAPPAPSPATVANDGVPSDGVPSEGAPSEGAPTEPASAEPATTEVPPAAEPLPTASEPAADMPAPAAADTEPREPAIAPPAEPSATEAAPSAPPAEAAAPAEAGPGLTPAVPETPAAADSLPAAELPADKPEDPFAEPAAGADKPPEEMPAETDVATPAADAPADPFAEPAAAESVPAEPAPAEAAAAEPEEPIGPRSAQVYAPEDVTKAAMDFAAADQRLVAAMVAADKNELKKARAGFFLSLYRFAEVFAAINRAPLEGQPAEFQQGLRQLSSDADRLKELRAYAAKWLAFGKRTTPGIVLAGTIEATEHIGKLYHLTVKLTDEAPSVEIVSRDDPRVDVGDEVIVLGAIIEQPVEQLAGYEGSSAVAVWSGITFKSQSGEK
jgi:hypothetical protein